MDNVTLRDIYNRFDRFEDKLDDRLKGFETRFEKFDGRIKTLEFLKERMMVIVAVITIIFNVTVGYISQKLFNN